MNAFYALSFFVLCSKDGLVNATVQNKVKKHKMNISGSCPDFFTQIGENCYALSNKKMSADDAFISCLEKGGYLANFETLEEALIMKFHLNTINTGLNYFVGARNVNRYVQNLTIGDSSIPLGDWRWIKDGAATKFEYFAFGKGEPNGSHEEPQDCMFFYKDSNYAFHNIFCDDPRYYSGVICETDVRKLKF